MRSPIPTALSPLLLITILACLAAVSCGTRVSRLDQNEVTDLSGRWNDSDSRLVSQAMIEELTGSGWYSAWADTSSRRPVVIVGRVKNETMEHIDTKAFIANMEHALISNGKLAFVVGGAERDRIRQERLDQLANASEESIKEFGRELGADFMLFGSLKSLVDQNGGTKITSYQVDLYLVNMTTNEKPWAGQKIIKKKISRSRFKL